MTQFHFSVPDDLGAWAEAQAAEAQLDGANEYVTTLLQRARADAEKLAWLQVEIGEGIASPIVETTIEDIIARGKLRHANRMKVSISALQGLLKPDRD